MKKFSIKVDLSAFFEDERKLAVILVDPDWTSVKCLQEKIQTLFGISQPMHFITEDGSYIPLQESVEILKITSLVKSYLPNTTESKKPEKGKRKVRSNQNEEHNMNDTLDGSKSRKKQKQQKTCSPGSLSKTSNAKQNHIRFEENTEENIVKPKALVKFHCALENQSTTEARVFTIQREVFSKSETDINENDQSMVIDNDICNLVIRDIVEQTISSTLPTLIEVS